MNVGRAIFAVVIVAGVLTLAACATEPRESLTLDLVGATVPVMLSSVATNERTAVLSYESGYSTMSVSSSSTVNGVTTTTTATMERDTRKPLKGQLQNLIVQNPPWLAVDSLSLSVKWMLGLAWSSSDYFLSLDIKTPLGK